MNKEEQEFYKSLMGNSEQAAAKEFDQEPDLSLEAMASRYGIDPEAIKKDIVKESQQELVSQANIPFSAEGRPQEATGDIGGVVKGAAMGLADISQSILNFGVDIADEVENLAASYGIGTGDIISDATRIDWSSKMGSPEDSVTVRAARGITKYVAPVVATMGAGSGVLAGLGIGAAVDLLTIDPKQERLSTLLRDEVPELKNFPAAYAVVSFLANNPDESAAAGRFKNMLEGLGVAAPVAFIFHGILKGVAAMRNMGVKAATALEVGATKEAALAKAAMPEAPKPSVEVPTPKVEEKIPDFIDETPIKEIAGEPKANLNNDNVVEFVKDYSKLNPKTAEDLFRPGKSFSELDAEAKAIINDKASLEKLLAWRLGDRPLTDAETKAAQYIMSNVGDNLIVAAEKAAASGADEDLLHLANMVEIFKYVDSTRLGAGSEAGRALNSHKLAADLAETPLVDFNANLVKEAKQDLVRKSLEAAGGSENVKDIAKTIKAINDMAPEDVLKALRNAPKTSGFQKFKSALESVAINGMISSPKTTAANFISNTLTTFTSNMVDLLTVGVGFVRRSADRLQIEDVTAQLRGQFGGFFEGVSAAGQAMRTGRGGPANVIKNELATQMDSISADALGIPVHQGMAYKVIGKIADMTGMAVGLPSRMNATADAFWGTILYRGKINQEATIAARKLGLKGAEAQKFIENRVKNVTVEMHESAQAFAKDNTFSSALVKGSFARSVEEAIDKVPMGKVVVPFFNTSANIIDYGFKHSPLAVLSTPIRRQIIAGGIEGDRAIARVMIGTFFTGAAAYMAAEGMLTGPDTRNWKVRQALEESGLGWQADSIKLGDSYVKIDRIDPFSSVLRLGAVMSNLRSYLSAGEYGELATIAGGAVIDFMTPEMLVDGYSRLFEAYNEAARYSETDKAKAAAIFSEISARLVPYSALQRDIKNLVDPLKGSTAIVMQDSSFLDKFTDRLVNRYKSISPWHSTDLPVQRNILGEPLVVPDGWGPDMISPFAMTKAGSSKLADTLNKLAGFQENMGPDPELPNLEIAMPPRRWSPGGETGVSIELTPHEYERFIMYSAGLDPKTGEKVGGVSLRDALESVTQSFGEIDPNMSTIQYGKMVGAISKVILQFRKAGQNMMAQDEEIMNRWQKAFNAASESKNIDVFQ